MSVATARNFVLRMVVATVLVAAGSFLVSSRAMAQGITTSGVRGLVTDEQGQPVASATVIVINSQTGNRYSGVTQTNGRYYLTNVAVGFYSVESRAIGYRPARRDGVILSLGQTGEVNLRMQAATVELQAITTTAVNPTDVMSPTRTGPGSAVTETMVRNLPSLGRDFADFLATVPQVVGGVGSSSATTSTSVAGTNNRYNNMQIDGSVNNDLFGLAASGAPGGQSNARPISVEAIKEFQVLIAPFDVRQGGFTGGLINAVTRSGTNQWHASVFGYFQGTSILGLNLVGRDSLHQTVTDFTQRQLGISISGPIIKDRLLFFANIEPQTRTAPYTGLQIGSDTTGGKDSVGIGIRLATANRIAQIVRDSSSKWGPSAFDPGGIGNPTLATPATNFFGKLTWQPSTNNTIELSFNHVNATNDIFSHSSTAAITSSTAGYELSNSGYQQANVTNTLRAIWTRPFGNRFNNEMILAYQKISDKRQIGANVPLMFVGGDRGQPFTAAQSPSTNVSFGAERFSHANSLDQRIIEITDNLTWAMGHHNLTLGTHNELLQFNNTFFAGKFGIWSFRDTTALLARAPFRYEIFLPGANGIGPIAQFNANQLGGYLQDNYTPNNRLNLTFGLRLDVPIMDRPNYNVQLDTATILAGPNLGQKMGINTSTSFPAHNALWSPRFGFNYDVSGNGTTQVRGGIGVFSGRPPYVWISNSFVNTGLEQTDLVCDGSLSTSGGQVPDPANPGKFLPLDTVPAFTTNGAAMPSSCVGPATFGAAASSIVFFDKNFQMPQNMRASFGMDHRLPWNMTATVDFMYTQWLNSIYLTDVNLAQGGTSFGEGNRALYGTIGVNTASWAPRRLTAQFRDVIKQSNANRDYGYQATFQLQKRFSNGLEFNGGYTYSRSFDLISMTSSISNSNLRFAVLDGTLDDRNLRPAAFDTPHRVTFSVTGNLPWRMKGTLQYAGRSGTPYAYVTSNDGNGDGLAGQDLVYVPLNAQDIQMCPLSGACTTTSQDPAAYKLLDAYINAEPCLANQRGMIMQRTSCRNPWQSFVNAHLAKTFNTFAGQSVEISADIFNLLSFLGIGGKIVGTSTGFEETNLLTLNRYNAALGRGVYTMATSLANLRRVDVTASRWRMLLGARYNL